MRQRLTLSAAFSIMVGLLPSPPSLTAYIPDAVLEGGDPFLVTVQSSSGWRLNHGTDRFDGDYLRDVESQL